METSHGSHFDILPGPLTFLHARKYIVSFSLNHWQTFATSVLDPHPPPVLPLLVMIRMTEAVIAELQVRGCAPLENFVFGIRLQLWPVFQKLMSENVTSLNKLAETASAAGGYFRRGPAVSDASVQAVCGNAYSRRLAYLTVTPSTPRSQITMRRYFPHSSYSQNRRMMP